MIIKLRDSSFIQRQEETPLYSALCKYIDEHNVPFHMPGHMQGRGASAGLLNLMGERALAADITQVLDMDDIHRPSNYTKRAQELAAECFGAEHTWFLINGSTCGNQAMFLAVLNEGDEVIVPRCAHRSLQAGLIFSGARPHYVFSPYDAETGVSLAVEKSELERLQREYPRTKAWAITSITPYGACANVADIAIVAHQHSLPLLVDEAWGPHFGLHPGLPQSALHQGADCVVQSAHKLLAALSQASLLHVRGNLVDRGRLHLALRMLESTSPSYLLLASLDLARRQAALDGESLWGRALEHAEEVRSFIRNLPGLSLMEQGAAFDYDKTRVVISAVELGMDGVELERTLRYRFNIQPEMSDMRNVVLVITPSQSGEDINRLKEALKEIASAPHGWISQEGIKGSLREVSKLEFPGFPEQILSPRQAYFSCSKAVPWKRAVGEICAELITPYPPGIPLICPGERIGCEHYEYLQALNKMGIPIDGLSDETLEYVKIIVAA